MSTSNRELEPVVSNDASAQLDTTQANLEGMGVSDAGSKKEVVARLARESKARMGPEGAIGEPEPPEKGKNVQPQFLGNQDESFSEELDAFQSASDRPQQLRAAVENSPDPYGRQAMFGSNFAHIGTLDKKAPSWNADLDTLMLEDVERALLDKALLSGDLAYVQSLCRKSGGQRWLGVASKMATADASDPMSELLGSKRERASLSPPF
ncbi:13346_t:CDS:2 [Racocetra fulgida]|uniref:13346_t:CDS:1 n=1 Tax=Racocetra fulgida TaxID=60492 RepID=A0A9N8WMV3_9GLOM|nr:13346_t:CDS:2 [Racocetra fulgida]